MAASSNPLQRSSSNIHIAPLNLMLGFIPSAPPWLPLRLQAGCPVNWDEAVAAAVDSYPPDSEPVRWTIMQQQQQQQQQQRQTAGITDGTYS